MTRSTLFWACSWGVNSGLVLALALAVSGARAETAESETVLELPRILVTSESGTPITQSGDTTGSGEHRFERDAIERFGKADGGLEGLLQQVPGVQFGEDRQGVERLTDLQPESFSISGGRFYENRVLLDGIGNSNRLDPAATGDGSGIEDIGGHEQSLFVDSDLIESLSVYDSNVPAAYGGFTGGVVDASTRRAGETAGGSVSLRGTSSGVTRFRTFTRDWDPNTEPVPPEPPQEPSFQRYRSTLNYTTPLTESLGLLLGVNRSYSQTPEVTLGETRNRTQANDNLLVKLSSDIGETGVLDVSATWAPYERSEFLSNVRDSDYSTHGGGYGVTLRYAWLGEWAEHEFQLGSSRSENRRSAPNGFYSWANTASRQWGREADAGLSREGGYGDLDKVQQSSNAKWTANLMPVTLGAWELEHQLGLEASHQRYGFTRHQTLYVHDNAVINTDIQCRGQSVDCVQAEQYFAGRRVYAAEDVVVNLNEAALFAESTASWQRLSATLGVRYDYNDFLRNHDLALRTRASFDWFDNRSTLLQAGLNRYYGAALLTYKLREARLPYYREYRGTEQSVVTDWERESGQGAFKYRFDDLDTPYSDEQVLALEQALWGGRLKLKWVHRDNRNEFARTTTDTQPDGYRYYLMNNEGTSDYQSVSLGWYAQYGATQINLHANWSESRSDNGDYDDPVSGTSADEHVWYRGERLAYGALDVLRSDFNRPVVANLAISHAFSVRLDAALNARYRGAYDQILATGRQVEGELIDSGNGSVRERLTEYADEERAATLLFDIDVSYRYPLADNRAWVAELQVNNLLDKRTHTVALGNAGIEAGRQLWLGFSLSF